MRLDVLINDSAIKGLLVDITKSVDWIPISDTAYFNPIVKTQVRQHQIINIAFQYALYGQIKYWHPEKTTLFPWVTEEALRVLQKQRPEYTQEICYYDMAVEIISEAKDYFNKFVKTGKPTFDFFKSCVYLAYLECSYRTNDFQKLNNVNKEIEEIIFEISQFLFVLPYCFYEDGHSYLLGATLGSISNLIKTARLTLIRDNTLIILDTSNQLSVKTGLLHEALTCYILNQLNQANYQKEAWVIDSIAFYFARFGLLYVQPIDAILDQTRVASDDLVNWFSAKLMKLCGLDKTGSEA